jgi:xylulokinase
MFFGMTPTTTKAHFIRAVIEGIAYDCNSNLEVARQAGAKIDKLTLNGGPTKSKLWNQITSDITGLHLDLPDVGKSDESGFPPEAAPLGDAILAAVGAGFYDNPLEKLNDIVKVKETFEPDMKNHEMYSEFYRVWRSIYHNLIADMKDHHDLKKKYDFS